MDMQLWLKTLGRVIRAHRTAAGKTQMAISDEANVDQGALSRIELGKQEADHAQLQSIAAVFGMRASELLAEAETIADSTDLPFVPKRMAQGVAAVPLISWVQAGNWQEAVDAYSRGQGAELIHTAAKVSPYAYALRIKGDSMTNPKGSPSFPEGTIIIVDPKRQIENMDLAVVRLVNEKEATFKRYMQDAGLTYLVPLNPQHPTITLNSPAMLCGVVVATAEHRL